MKEKKLSIGAEDFKEVKENCYYVDKTMILSEVHDRPSGGALLFTRPRRFGKSLSISMMDRFYSDQYDSSSLFEGTELSRLRPDVLREMNQYNVLRLNLKSFSSPNYESFLSLLQAKIIALAEATLSSMEIHGLPNHLKRFVEGVNEGELDDATLQTSLALLMEIAFRVKGKKSVVLIDEYDTPYQSADENGYFALCRDFLKTFLGDVLKGNEYLHKAVLTGVTPVAKTSVFSDLNNIVTCTVLDNRKNEYFGFDEQETKGILDYFGFDGSMEEVASWYDGYVFQRKKVFNPWSVLSFIDNGFLYRPYWVGTGSNRLIRECLEGEGGAYLEETLPLFQRDGLECELNVFIDFPSATDSSALLSLMVQSGYLAAEEIPGTFLYHLSFPNEEVRLSFQREILTLPGVNQTRNLSSLRKAIIGGDVESIRALLPRLVLASFSYLDLRNEKSYQLIVVVLTSLLFGTMVVKSEVESGLGRCDILMMEKNGKDLAFLIELKHLKGRRERKRLMAAANKALNQIKEHDYAETARRFGFRHIYAYGMSLSGKSVECAFEEIS